MDGNTANYDAGGTLVERGMVVQNLTQNSTYRSFIGCFNAVASGFSITLEFWIIDATNSVVGTAFSKTIAPWDFISFNPFVEAGVGSGTYTNCWLWVNPTASGNTGTNSRGAFIFGSSANNYTNDTYAHIAVQFN